MNTRTNSVVNFYDCSNFNRKNGRTCLYNTSKIVHPPNHIHSLFLCKCTLLGNGIWIIRFSGKNFCNLLQFSVLKMPLSKLSKVFIFESGEFLLD